MGTAGRHGSASSARWRAHKSRRPALAGRPVDVVRKPSSVPYRGRPRCGGDHSSRAAVTGRLEQPTRELGRVTLRRRSPFDERTSRPHTWPCSRWGLPCHLRCRRCGGLLPRRFTLACRVDSFEASRRAVSSLLHFPSRSRDRALPGIALFGARTFLPPRFVPRLALRDWFTTGDRLYGIDAAQRTPVRALRNGKLSATCPRSSSRTRGAPQGGAARPRGSSPRWRSPRHRWRAIGRSRRSRW